MSYERKANSRDTDPLTREQISHPVLGHHTSMHELSMHVLVYPGVEFIGERGTIIRTTVSMVWKKV